MLLQAEMTRLARKQESEMQSQCIAEKLEVEKRMTGKDAEEHKKKIEELQEELMSIQEDLELRNGVVNVLSSTNRKTNDVLQDAKKNSHFSKAMRTRSSVVVI
jgi:chromosome segregation ATPase